MISSATSIAVSGLQAASKRLSNSANNIANQSSTLSQVNGETVAEPFHPSDVLQTSLSSGGVQTELRERQPATVAVADGNGGVTQVPNVNTEEEVIAQQFASYDFKANLKVIEAQNETIQSVLDIIA